jgi:hypothetical protein
VCCLFFEGCLDFVFLLKISKVYFTILRNAGWETLAYQALNVNPTGMLDSAHCLFPIV